MNFNDLLRLQSIDPQEVVAFRHRPTEPGLRRTLPWLAAEQPDVFNAYQQTHGEKVEKALLAMVGKGYVASFIGHHPGRAIFIGLYSIDGSRPLEYDEFWAMPAHVQMKSLGMIGWASDSPRENIVWFDLKLTSFYQSWQRRLVVGWPPPDRSWWRRAQRNDLPILSIAEDDPLSALMPEWSEIDFSWSELALLPARWKADLRQWRGIYYIFDTSDGRGYVGSAYGEANLLGRWLNYSATGHGGNVLLRKRDPASFRFTILQRVSPDMDSADVIRLEASWKQRLHSRQPFGLNEN